MGRGLSPAAGALPGAVSRAARLASETARPTGGSGGTFNQDEIIVTLFTIGAGQQTLPIWIFNNLFRPNRLPIVNVVAILLVLASTVPVYLAHRLTREEEGAAAVRGGGTLEGGAAAEALAVP